MLPCSSSPARSINVCFTLSRQASSTMMLIVAVPNVETVRKNESPHLFCKTSQNFSCASAIIHFIRCFPKESFIILSWSSNYYNLHDYDIIGAIVPPGNVSRELQRLQRRAKRITKRIVNLHALCTKTRRSYQTAIEPHRALFMIAEVQRRHILSIIR